MKKYIIGILALIAFGSLFMQAPDALARRPHVDVDFSVILGWPPPPPRPYPPPGPYPFPPPPPPRDYQFEQYQRLRAEAAQLPPAVEALAQAVWNAQAPQWDDRRRGGPGRGYGHRRGYYQAPPDGYAMQMVNQIRQATAVYLSQLNSCGPRNYGASYNALNNLLDEVQFVHRNFYERGCSQSVTYAVQELLRVIGCLQQYY